MTAIATSTRHSKTTLSSPELTLSRLASHEPMKLLPSSSHVKDAITLMLDERQSCVIIGDNQIPSGIITEHDIVKLTQTAFETGSLNKPVTEVMSTNLICVSPTTPLSDALALAEYHSIRHLIIKQADKTFAGVIDYSDIVHAYTLLVNTHSKLENENQELLRLSHQDALMGVGNRRAMEATLKQLDFQCHHFAITYSLCIIDVDDFKLYNDTYGHPAGDLALQQLAQLIKSELRDSTMVFRYGGEEIVVALTNTLLANAERTMQRVKSKIEQAAIPHSRSPSKVLSVSIGIAESRFSCCWSEVLEKADRELYAAKHSGKNIIVCSEKI